MSFRNTILAVIVLAGLVGFIYYYEYLGEEGREEAVLAEGNVFRFDKEKLRKVRIEGSAGEVVELSRDGSGWNVGTAPPVAADESKVGSLLATLNNLPIARTLEGAGSGDLSQYGLEEPLLQVDLVLDDSDPARSEMAIRIGDKAPIGNDYYARRPDGEDVLLVSGGIGSITAARPQELRDRKLAGIRSYEVELMKLERGEDRVALRRQEETWMIEAPISFPADGSRVEDLLADLQSAEAASFESEDPGPEELSGFGLTEPSLILSLVSRDEEAPVQILFGGPAPGGPIHARRDGRKAVMTVDAELFRKLAEVLDAPDTIRDARVAPFNRFKLSELSIATGNEEIHLYKGDDSRWRWQAAQGPAIPSEDVNLLLDAIEGLKADRFDDSPPPGSPAGTSVTLAEDDSGEETPMTITAAGDGRFTSSRTPSVYIVSRPAAEKFAEAVAAIHEPEPPVEQEAEDVPETGGEKP